MVGAGEGCCPVFVFYNDDVVWGELTDQLCRLGGEDNLGFFACDPDKISKDINCIWVETKFGFINYDEFWRVRLEEEGCKGNEPKSSVGKGRDWQSVVTGG